MSFPFCSSSVALFESTAPRTRIRSGADGWVGAVMSVHCGSEWFTGRPGTALCGTATGWRREREQKHVLSIQPHSVVKRAACSRWEGCRRDLRSGDERLCHRYVAVKHTGGGGDATHLIWTCPHGRGLRQCHTSVHWRCKRSMRALPHPR
jgi:hypothetical protein